MTRWVLITGASAGLGAQFARYYAKLGYNLVLTARRTDRLEALAKEVGVKCVIITADLADDDGPRKIFAETERRGVKVDYLINNAGYGARGSYLSHSWSDHARFLRVMVDAVCELTYLYLPGMCERGFGRVINVSSVAGLVPSGATDTLYSGAKALLIKFSQSLNGQLRGTDVNVTVVCPGFFYSEFHDVLGVRAQMNKTSKWLWLTTEQIVEAAAKGVEANKAMVVPGFIYKVIVVLMKFIPQNLASTIASRSRNR